MADAIYKLQPHRTMHLQGFDGYGCTAALWGASDNGWTLSGTWGEQADFAIVVLWDADNQFEHPRARYLPDFAFDGITLAFDLAVTNCVPIDCDLYPWIDWPFLNVAYTDGTEQHDIRLSDHATGYTGAGPGYVPAEATFVLAGVPALNDYVEIACEGEHFTHQFYFNGEGPADAITNLVTAINNGNPPSANVTATGNGASITLTWKNATAGRNANRVGVYANSTGAATWTPSWQLFSGGQSPSGWHIVLPMSTVLAQPTKVQRMWLTFAADMQPGNFQRSEFQVSVIFWTVTDANGRRALKVAGPGSVRIEETDAWVARAGYWEDGGAQWWSEGFAIRSAYSMYEARSLTIETHCGAVHDIWVGTRLDANCGQVSVRLDGGSAVTLDTYAAAGACVRRRLFSGVSAGAHVVTITLLATKAAASAGWYFYFDFLECAVLSDVPDAPEMRTDVAVATDFDTDASYKMSPQRLLWAIQKTGLVGVIDHYMGVFWWPERVALAGYEYPHQTLTFAGAPEFAANNYTTVTIGLNPPIRHNHLVGDTAASVARCFALLINRGSTGVWAGVDGAALTITGRGTLPAYHYVSTAATLGTQFTVTVGAPGGTSTAAIEWGVDPGAAPVIGRAARDWHADYFAGLVAAGMTCVVSFSQELVNPPAAWVQCFADGTRVETATGFGTLASSQCCFSTAVGAYMASAYGLVATMMESAGLVAWLQFGEVGWWFNAGGSPGSMAFYDADTGAAAVSALGGRGLHAFAGPGDDPGGSNAADVAFLAGRLAGYVAAVRAAVAAGHAGAKFELLWPLDVNLPETRRLNWAVNLPAAWKARAGSGFDSFLCEGFQFGGTDRDLNLVARTAAYPFTELAWDRASCGYLMGIFNAGWPWERDYLMGARSYVPTVKIWAWDHVCLYGRMVPVPAEARTVVVTAGG